MLSLFAILSGITAVAAGPSDMMDPARCSGVLITNPISEIQITLPEQVSSFPVEDGDPAVDTVCVVSPDGVPSQTIFLQVPQIGQVAVRLPYTRQSYIHMPVQQWCYARGMNCPWDNEANLRIQFGGQAIVPSLSVIRGLNQEDK